MRIKYGMTDKTVYGQTLSNLICSFCGVFGGESMTTQEVKRKLTAILSADVKGYSRLMGRMRRDVRTLMHTKK